MERLPSDVAPPFLHRSSNTTFTMPGTRPGRAVFLEPVPRPASPGNDKQSVDSGARRYLGLGVPTSKIVIGVPFYARGWSGMPPANNGSYQAASGPARGFEEGAGRAPAGAPIRPVLMAKN